MTPRAPRTKKSARASTPTVAAPALKKARASAQATSGDGKARRPDALRNRERIVQAAYAVFAEHGVDAQMTDIAAAAGVGVATLYRNFQTKEDLVNALLDEYFTRAVAVAEDAVEDPDTWQALVRFFQWVTSLQVEDRALSQFLSGRIAGSPELRSQRVALYEILSAVAERAKDQGQLRRDVQISDLRTILGAVAFVSSAGFPERAIRRLVNVIIDGLRAPGQMTLEGPPVTTEELDASLMHRARDEGESVRAFKRGRRPWPTRSGAAG